MNLAEIREWFVRESGRFDLVTDPDTLADAGANRYINAGQRMLDRLVDVDKMIGRYFKILPAGEHGVVFRECRAIKEVWIVDETTDHTRRKLEKKEMVWLRKQYAVMGQLTPSVPLYYAPAILRAAPELYLTPIDELDGYVEFMDVMYTEHYAYNGIYVMPPPAVDYLIEVWGFFYSTALTGDSDTSYWSTVHPELLVMGAQAMLEMFNRNTEGVKDWLDAIKIGLTGITFDRREEELTDITHMGG